MSSVTALKKDLVRLVSGCVKATAQAHNGCITRELAGSAAKRIVGQLMAQYDVKLKINESNRIKQRQKGTRSNPI